MASAVLASLIAGLAWAVAEAFGRFYPSRQTWLRLRRARGNEGMRTLRARFEAPALHRLARRLAAILVGLVVVWVGVASLLDKRWYEVALDLTPNLIVAAALLRAPPILKHVAERMKDHERRFGADEDLAGDGGPAAIAL